MPGMVGKTWDVLDHGFIKVVDHMGTDESIIEAARMSTNKGFQRWTAGEFCVHCGETPESLRTDDMGDPAQCASAAGDYRHEWKQVPGDAGLLEFLWENYHSTPFEMAELVIEVQAPIMVFREWHRHRTQSYNELSARYTQMPDLHYLPPVDRFRPKVTANKQESGNGAVLDYLDLMKWQNRVEEEQSDTYANYDSMTQSGVPREIARINTPVSRYSRMRAKTDLLNWLRFLDRRMRDGAQHEIRVYAKIIGEEIIKELWPRTFALFEEHTLYSTTFSRSEMAVLRDLVKVLNAGAPMVAKMIYQAGLSEKKCERFLKKLDMIISKEGK